MNLDYYCAHMTDLTYLYEGVEEGLVKLVDAGHQVAVMTNKNGGPARSILDQLGVGNLFCAVVGGGDVEHLKPHPDGIHACMDAAGISTENVWMVGDHYTVLESARNAGVKSAYVHYGFGDPREYRANEYFASFCDLVGYFV